MGYFYLPCLRLRGGAPCLSELRSKLDTVRQLHLSASSMGRGHRVASPPFPCVFTDRSVCSSVDRGWSVVWVLLPCYASDSEKVRHACQSCDPSWIRAGSHTGRLASWAGPSSVWPRPCRCALATSWGRNCGSSQAICAAALTSDQEMNFTTHRRVARKSYSAVNLRSIVVSRLHLEALRTRFFRAWVRRKSAAML